MGKSKIGMMEKNMDSAVVYCGIHRDYYIYYNFWLYIIGIVMTCLGLRTYS